MEAMTTLIRAWRSREVVVTIDNATARQAIRLLGWWLLLDACLLAALVLA